MQLRTINERPHYRVILRYGLMQLPAIAVVIAILAVLRSWLGMPLWLFWTFLLLWIAKDIIMFPVVRHAYDRRNTADPDSLTGLRGTAVEHLSPSGYVRVRGELWDAEVVKGALPVKKGESVQILGSRGLRLEVSGRPGVNSSRGKQ